VPEHRVDLFDRFNQPKTLSGIETAFADHSVFFIVSFNQPKTLSGIET